MYHRPKSTYSRVSDRRSNPEYELTPFPATSDSVSQQFSQDRSGAERAGLLYPGETISRVPSTNNTVTHRRFGGWRRQVGLGRYFRLHSPDDSTPPHRGWRKAVIAAAILAGCVLMINIVFIIIVRTKLNITDGVGLIHIGDCATVNLWNTALHLLINILSTILLAASGFTMQCLSSPTRNEVNSAHARNISLEIGLASFTNLFHVKPWKTILWLLLCLSTMPLHLLWNSTIFSTTSANLFSFVVADESFLSGASYQSPNDTVLEFCYDVGGAHDSGNGTPSNVINTIYDDYRKNLYSNMSFADCYRTYVNSEFLTLQRNVIIIVEQPKAPYYMGGCGYGGQSWNGSSVVGVGINYFAGPYWMGGFNQDYDISGGPPPAQWSLGNYTVASCASEKTPSSSKCQLQVMSYILYVVVGCNLVKFICICITAHYLWSLDEPILATIGDAACPFLESPDETTKSLCLLDHQAVRRDILSNKNLYNPIYLREKKRRLYFATSPTRWWSMMVLCTLYLIVGFVLWYGSMSLTRYSMSETMKLKFGAVDSKLLLGLEGPSGHGLLGDVIVANSFQLALSTTYFLYNSLYTAQYGAIEWASYIQAKRKTLRVTWPVGQQRSTYYLQLPYRYGIPLLALLVLMHFLISQSIFLARLQFYDWVGMPFDTSQNFADVGFSPRATLASCLVGSVLILAQIAHSLRPLDNRMPIHGNSSLVISAMCHPNPEDGDAEAQTASSDRPQMDSITTKPIMWGVTQDPVMSASINSTAEFEDGRIEERAGHCGFSSEMVRLPETGQKYR